MLTFMNKQPEQLRIVEIDNHEVVHSFHEKVLNPPGNRANGALYAFEQHVFDYLGNLIVPKPSDFSTEVIPKLLGRTNLGRPMMHI